MVDSQSHATSRIIQYVGARTAEVVSPLVELEGGRCDIRCDTEDLSSLLQATQNDIGYSEVSIS